MSLVSSMQAFITQVGTDWKNIWAKIGTGSLNTTAQNLTGAVNEVKTTADAAIAGSVPDATTSVKGKVELATDAETIAYADTARAVTPSNLAAMIADKLDTNTALGSSNVKWPSQLAIKTYVDGIIAAANAMVYKGVVDASANPNYPAANAGDTYRISVAGRIGGGSGPKVQVGDILLCLVDSTSAGNDATVGANWNIIQANIDGAVIGPAGAVDNRIAQFDGTSGSLLEDSGVTWSNAAIGGGSATVLPTSAQVVAYAQALHANLTAFAGLSLVADRLPYANGTGTLALTPFTSAGRALVDDADASAQRDTLSVYSRTEIGDPATDFAAYYTAAKA